MSNIAEIFVQALFTASVCLYLLIKNVIKKCFIFPETKSFVKPAHIYAIHDAICQYPANIADMSLTNVTLDTQCFLNDRHGYLALTYDARDNLLYYSENNTFTISRIHLEIGATSEIVAGGTGVVKGTSCLLLVLNYNVCNRSTHTHTHTHTHTQFTSGYMASDGSFG